MIVSSTGLTLRELQRAGTDGRRCPTCGKSRIVVNVAGSHQRFRGETVSRETHCACPLGGPAYVPPPEAA